MSKGKQPVTNRPFLSRKQALAHQKLLAESKRLKEQIDRWERSLRRLKAKDACPVQTMPCPVCGDTMEHQ